MNQAEEVIAMSIGMFVITFMFGYTPHKLNTSQRVMNLISIFGAGLLVGAALIVIIPEGMIVLYEALSKGVNNEKLAGDEKSADGASKDNESHGGMDPNIDKYVGASLIIGFASMLILD
jgi:zinc transporter 9